jgi:aminopeptidase N
MDEGFSNYAEARVFAWLHKKNFFEGAEEYGVYFNVARSRYDEPMSTPANFYNTNLSYNVNAYYKGSIFLRQLGYIVGEPAMDKILMEYYRQWKFKHPTPDDFVRVAENVSKVQLQWYKQYMLYTTKTIDYSIDSLWEEGGLARIRLRNKGDMPMPIDLALKFKDGTSEMHYVPLSLMFGNKPVENTMARMDHEAWRWVDPTYIITVNKKLGDIISVEIDPTNRLADVDGRNNLLEIK